MKTVTVKELIKILEEYPSDMEVYYVTRYALTPLEVKEFGGRCIGVDIKHTEINKYGDAL